MEISIKLIVVIITVNVAIALSVVIFGDINILIEEGVMNFWSMVGALGAFACSLILLIIKIAEKLEKLNGHSRGLRR